MKRFAVLLLLALACPLALAAEDIGKVNGSIHTEANGVYGNLDTVNGSIHLASGVQAGTVKTVNGSISADDNAQARSMETVNGGIHAGRGLALSEGVTTVNGDIFIDHGSHVGADVETVNGAIGLVGAEVGRNVETANGDITVGVGSHVKGGIKVLRPSFNLSMTAPHKPRIIIGPNAVVDGALTFEREVTLYVHDSATIGKVNGATIISFSAETAPRD